MKRRAVKITVFILIAVIIVAVALFSALRWLYPKHYSPLVEKYADEYGIDSTLVYAIIKCESNFNENALSSAGAHGLMQITEATYEWALTRQNDKQAGAVSLFDPELNIRYGCAIYSILENEFLDPSVALAAYNAGRGRVLSWLSSNAYSDDAKTLHTIPFKETDGYVKKVLKTQQIYNLIY